MKPRARREDAGPRVAGAAVIAALYGAMGCVHDSPEYVLVEVPRTAPAPAPAPRPELQDSSQTIAPPLAAPHRLNRTITLGQSIPSYGPSESRVVASTGSGPNTNVTVVNVYNAPPPVFVGGGFWPSSSSHAWSNTRTPSNPWGRAASPGSLPPVGGDWPRVPDYGPRFPR